MTKNIKAILIRIAKIKAKTSNDILTKKFSLICQLGVLQDRQAAKLFTQESQKQAPSKPEVEVWYKIMSRNVICSIITASVLNIYINNLPYL